MLRIKDRKQQHLLDPWFFPSPKRRALDIYEESDQANYICEKTLWDMRLYASRLGIDGDIFDAIAIALAEIFKVDTSRQRIDSVHIQYGTAGPHRHLCQGHRSFFG